MHGHGHGHDEAEVESWNDTLLGRSKLVSESGSCGQGSSTKVGLHMCKSIECAIIKTCKGISRRCSLQYPSLLRKCKNQGMKYHAIAKIHGQGGYPYA